MKPLILIKDQALAKAAASSKPGRQFWTGGRIGDAQRHIKTNPDDVCMVRYQGKKILIGGPIPAETAVDVTDKEFSHVADSFDVGQMTAYVVEWFKKDFDTDVTVNILESGDAIVVSSNSKLISLSRQTPALLDMAATLDGQTIGQYSSAGTLGHSGDMNSTIGGVRCLHHEVDLKSEKGRTKKYFLVGYSGKPLKAWRDSRVFWIVHDSAKETCWLVPHDLSHEAVGNTVSATMSLVSKSNEDGTVSICHMSCPVQASLSYASPLSPDNRVHKTYLNECMAAANTIDWSVDSDATAYTENTEKKPHKAVFTTSVSASGKNASASTEVDEDASDDIDRAIALFDSCKDDLLVGFPNIPIHGKRDNLSTMHGPIKTFAGGCCANSRVVVIDGSQACATSEINSVFEQLSGVIIIKTDGPNIYKLNQVRWNMSRGQRTLVIAFTPDGCQHLYGPLPPSVQYEDNPTPTAGDSIPMEVVKDTIRFALSPESDTYYGPLYQPVPNHEQASCAVADFIEKMSDKDFSAIVRDDDEFAADNAFNDNDFCSLMHVINVLSVSNATAVERNNHAIRLTKFLQKCAKKVASGALDADPAQRKDNLHLEFLDGWSGDLEWAVESKEVLQDILKESSIKIVVEDGITDLTLHAKLDVAIEAKRSQLQRRLRERKQATFNSWKKTFHAVFEPAIDALMRCIGENPKYQKLFPEVRNGGMAGVITRATQSTNKNMVLGSPEDIMALFHRLGATSFIHFKINFLQTWKAKIANELCIADQPGHGFNDPKSFVPPDHRIEDGPKDPAAAYETDVRHRFILPVFVRLPKIFEEDDDDSDLEDVRQMPIAPNPEDLAEYLLMRREFELRNPEQGPRHPMWLYVDWLFHRIKTIHQVHEKQAAPLAMKALGYAILQITTKNPEPDRRTMEIVASIIHAINFISARGEPPHAIIDTFFNLAPTYVPMTKETEKNPWQIEVVNILSRAVDYVRPLMSAKEYAQIRCNFQRAAANIVKRHIVHKLIEDVREETKKNAESHDAYVARVNGQFYPAYREIVETLGMLIETDPGSFQLTEELRERIESLHHTVTVVWSKSMRRCRVGPVREMVKALKAFSQRGDEAMAYIVDRKPYLERLYDQVYHIKYESCDQVMIEEVCNIIRARTRNPEHENHGRWLARLAQAVQDVTEYDEKMSGFAHGNNYKRLPTELMLKMLDSLKINPASDDAVTFGDVKKMLAHINIDVKTPADLKVNSGNPDGKKPVLEQIRKAWWMCPDVTPESVTTDGDDAIQNVALIPTRTGLSETSNIIAVLGDTYHRFKVARLFSCEMGSMRAFVRENYKFHVEWFEDTIRAAGLPGGFDLGMVQGNEVMAIYAIVQRLVHEMVQDEADRGDRARGAVYGEVMDPMEVLANNDNDASRDKDSTPLAIEGAAHKKEDAGFP